MTLLSLKTNTNIYLYTIKRYKGIMVWTMVLPFSLFMLGLVRNQEREEANIAATQNSPPLDLLGEIWGGGFALLLGKRQKEEKYYNTEEY